MFSNSSELLEYLIHEDNTTHEGFVVDDDRYKMALQNANIMDGLAREIDATLFDIKINEDLTIDYSIGSYDISVCEKIHWFIELLRSSNSVRFHMKDKESLITTFNMPGVWVKK